MTENPGCERYAESAGRKYRLMTLPDFRKFRSLATDEAPEWTTHTSSETFTVQSKPPGDESTKLNIIRAHCIMERVPPLLLYNQLHDADYRKTWDENMLKGYNIVILDKHNDIGYYAAKFPWPLTNRDFCNMRSWMEFTNGEFIIFNHSEPHESEPPHPGFIRACSILTGYYIRPHNGGKGCLLTYVTHSDICGAIPHAVMNFAMTVGARKLLAKCESCTEKYPEFMAATYPPDHVFPWRTPPMDWDSLYAYPEDEIEAKKAAGEAKAAAAAIDAVSATDDDDDVVISKDAAAAGGKPTDEVRVIQSPSPKGAPRGDGPNVSLAPMPPRFDDPLTVQQYRCIMQDAMDAVDRSFIREGRAPTSKEYMIRLRGIIEGIRLTTA